MIYSEFSLSRLQVSVPHSFVFLYLVRICKSAKTMSYVILPHTVIDVLIRITHHSFAMSKAFLKLSPVVSSILIIKYSMSFLHIVLKLTNICVTTWQLKCSKSMLFSFWKFPCVPYSICIVPKFTISMILPFPPLTFIWILICMPNNFSESMRKTLGIFSAFICFENIHELSAHLSTRTCICILLFLYYL